MASTDYLLPQLPFGSAEYTIVRWLKRAGDALSAGDPLLVVVNDRVEVALPAACAGTLDRVFLVEGAAVVAGARVAAIAAHTTAAGAPDAAPASSSDLPIAKPAIRISPVARRIAVLRDVDITCLHGTGVSGRIVKADILATLAELPAHHDALSPAASPIPHPPSPIPYPLSGDAYVLTALEVDMERVAAVIAQHGPYFARRRLELSYHVCVALAAVAALPSHPLLNSYWADTAIVSQRRIHLAIVSSVGAPVRSICDAQDLNLRGLARRLADAASEQRSADRTFTIVDLGDHVWGDLAVWAGGRAAALGIGALRTCAQVLDHGAGARLAIRKTALLTLAYDARVLDQRHADAFLSDVKRRLEQFHA